MSGARLYMQHQLTRKNFHNRLLEPCIPPPTSSCRVADVACGTGVWSLELSEEVGPVGIEGLDISLKDVPSAEFTPAHVSFHQFDLLQELPAEMTGRFDIVNIQFVMLFIKDSNFSSALHRLLQMLKPGGWLQWTDSNSANLKWPSGTPGKVAVQMPKLFSLTKELWGQSKSQWIAEIGHRFSDAGLEEVKVLKPSPQPSTLVSTQLQSLWGLEDGFQYLRGKLPADAIRRWDDQYALAVAETQELKLGFDMSLVRAVGRKPL
ncbi:hypothetical protein M409DRAFT_28228 [Zasmidium cellare ATCC 36951]|uniref:Methyltransferase domain-containing protein n=1 Tax=Zasmidium cellare ATCC 36951 TaxID=1080233 RepID=A0A6A6C5M7_ZASCE|nr:uncharacterized protein M409DRAFT_28228 [Zasmidium cellare ATCC 36951]KAF2161500.1 hypothetical protein M409DRAFT_28228 [Zasmidium cellare ATCC 36951]